MNKLQQKSGAMVRDMIIDTLKHASEEDEFADQITERCERAHTIDLAAVDTDTMMNDPKVKAAFKKFVNNIIGGFQQMEDDYAPRKEGE